MKFLLELTAKRRRACRARSVDRPAQPNRREQPVSGMWRPGSCHRSGGRRRPQAQTTVCSGRRPQLKTVATRPRRRRRASVRRAVRQIVQRSTTDLRAQAARRARGSFARIMRSTVAERRPQLQRLSVADRLVGTRRDAGEKAVFFAVMCPQVLPEALEQTLEASKRDSGGAMTSRGRGPSAPSSSDPARTCASAATVSRAASPARSRAG
jgi:hypothetical protein